MKISLAIGLTALMLTACTARLPTEPLPADTTRGGALTAGFYTSSLESGGRSRDFTVFVPPGYDEQTPLTLIVALHGGFGTGQAFERQSRLSRAAAERGVMVVYPNGYRRSWNAGTCCGAAARDAIDDVTFISRLIAHLRERFAIDDTRIYGTGFSNGAMMLHRLACERPALFAGIAPVAGPPMIDDCPADAAPIATLLIQGTADPRIPFDGGTVNDSFRPAFDAVVARMAQRNRCDARPHRSADAGEAICRQRSGCAAPVQACVIEGLGHQWPGGRTLLPALLGNNSDDYDASRGIVAFATRDTN